MKISVVMPVYNVEDFIHRSINSVLSQEGITDFELIIVDDCGTDSSIQQAKKLSYTDKRIKIISNPKNIGTYHSRRTGVEISSGELIVFLDPDDTLAPYTLSKLWNSYNLDKPDIIFFGVRFCPKRKWYKKRVFSYTIEKKKSILESIYNPKKREFLWGGTPGKAYRKKFILEHLKRISIDPDLRLVYYEDQLLLYSALLYSKKISNVYYEGYIYHINSSSISNTINNEKILSNLSQHKFIQEKLLEIVSNEKLSEKDLKIYLKYLNFLKSDYYLISRKLDSYKSYLYFLKKSIKTRYDKKTLFAIIIYIITFKKIKF